MRKYLLIILTQFIFTSAWSVTMCSNDSTWSTPPPSSKHIAHLVKGDIIKINQYSQS